MGGKVPNAQNDKKTLRFNSRHQIGFSFRNNTGKNPELQIYKPVARSNLENCLQ